MKKLLLLALGVPVLLNAQVPVEGLKPEIEEPPPLARLGIVALGTPPPISYVKATKDHPSAIGPNGESIVGDLVASEGEAGSSPPHSLFIPVNKDEAKIGMTDKYFSVGLNRLRSLRNVYTKGSQKCYIDLWNIEDQDPKRKRKLYFEVPPLKPASETILFIHPTGKAPTPWLESPKLTAIELASGGEVSAPLLIKNMFNETVAVKVNNEIVTLKPGRGHSFDGEFEEGRARIDIRYKSDGKVAKLIERVNISDGRVAVVVIYPNTSKSPNARKIKVFRATPKLLTKPEQVEDEAVVAEEPVPAAQ